MNRVKSKIQIVSHLIFWGWNALFILTLSMGVTTVFGPWFWEVVSEGMLPMDFIFAYASLVLLPPALTGLALWKLRKRPGKLLELFYGVEIPLVAFLLFRLVCIRQLTPATGYLGTAFLLGILAFGILVFSESGKSSKSSLLRYGLSCFSGLTGLYLTLLGTVYIIPAGVEFLVWFFRFEFLAWFRISNFTTGILGLYILFQLLLLFLTASVLLAGPAALLTLLFRSFGRAYKESRVFTPAYVHLAVATCFILLTGLGFHFSNRQPQRNVLRLVTEKPIGELSGRDEEVRQGLLNAYLAPFRYLTHSKGREVSRLWGQRLLKSESGQKLVQSFHDYLAAPFIYDGTDMRADQELAAKYYRDFFDGSIQDLESEVVSQAVTVSMGRNSVGAGAIDRDKKNVHIRSQDLRFTEENGVVTVQVHEVLENKTSEQQEVLYHFLLPEDAVVTGLWLGEKKENRFQVAPRGAAQKVYRAEVQRRVDPAFMEQIGPRQYRLRVFPIPATLHYPKLVKGRIHVWWEYQVLGGTNQIVPVLSEKRNVFWDERSIRTLQGRTFNGGEGWFPSAKQLPQFRSPQILAGLEKRVPMKLGGKIRVLVDGSYSMKRHRESVLAQLESIAEDEEVEIFFARPKQAPIPVGKNLPSFGGTWKYAELLELTESIVRDDVKAYVILTDDNPYDKLEDWTAEIQSKNTVWFVPVNQSPVQYERKTLDHLVRHRGGETDQLTEAIFRARLLKSNSEVLHVTQNWIWKKNMPTSDSPLRKIASVRRIESEASRLGSSLAALDQIHTLARENEIVSPFSSMLVLVEDRQREELKKAESESDRFNRAQESGEEILQPPPGTNLGVTATPEPHEWALLFVAALMLYSSLKSSKLMPTYAKGTRYRKL